MSVNWMTTVQFPEHRYPFLHCYVGITPEGHLASFQVDTASLKGKAGECEVSTTCLPAPRPNTMSGSVPLCYLTSITYPYINYLLTYGLKMKAYHMNSNLTYAVPSAFTMHVAKKRTQKVTHEMAAYFYDLHC